MKPILFAAALAAALPLAACNTPSERAAGGALVGGATGAAWGYDYYGNPVCVRAYR